MARLQTLLNKDIDGSSVGLVPTGSISSKARSSSPQAAPMQHEGNASGTMRINNTASRLGRCWSCRVERRDTNIGNWFVDAPLRTSAETQAELDRLKQKYRSRQHVRTATSSASLRSARRQLCKFEERSLRMDEMVLNCCYVSRENHASPSAACQCCISVF